MNYISKNLSSELWEDFQAYFEFDASCSGCWCMNHRLPMGLNFEGEAAKLAMKELVQSGRVYGVLAYSPHDLIPIGWCALDRRKTLPGHDCIGQNILDADDVWSIHCVTSRKDYKRQGVENFLVSRALQLVRELNGSFVEAYPEPGSDENISFKTWNSFNGYESFYLKNGFEKQLINSTEFYSVVKKNI